MAKIRPDLLLDCNYSHFCSTRDFLLTLFLTSLARAPNASWCCFAASAAVTAKIQSFYDSMWNLESSLKLISNKNWLFAGTSSGAVPARDLSSSIISCDFSSWRYLLILLCRGMFQKIHWECVTCRSFEMNHFVQWAPLRLLLDMAK